MNQLERKWQMVTETDSYQAADEPTRGMIKRTFFLGAMAVLTVLDDCAREGITGAAFHSRMQEWQDYAVGVMVLGDDDDTLHGVGH